jgi:IclR family KDG regulon transcriptional repressor
MSSYPNPSQSAPPTRTRAIERAAMTLIQFSQESPHHSIRSLSKATGIDLATQRRIIMTLCHHGILRRSTDPQLFEVGEAVVRIASGYLRPMGISAIARPVITDLAQRFGVTTFISRLENQRATCVLRVDGNPSIHVRWWEPGATMSFTKGAAPKLLLAHNTNKTTAPRKRQTGTSTPLPSTKYADASELINIRERGYAFAENDVAVGLAALAVPIFTQTGAFYGALSVGGLSPLIPNPIGRRGKSSLLKAMQQTAFGIGAQLEDVT